MRDRFNISKFAIRHSKLTICFWLAIAVAGLLAFSSLKYALFPDITFPVVVVNATAPIETALESETQLTLPIEKAIQSLEGVRKISSSTTPGRSVANLRFRVGTALEEATTQVEERIDQATLPTGANIEVIPLNLNEVTAISYALSSNRSDNRSGAQMFLVDLSALAEKEILPPLREIPGVLRVDLIGTGFQGSEGAHSDTSENFLAALKKAPQLVRFDRRDALAIQIVKRADANTLEVTRKVMDTAEQLAESLPAVQLTLAATQADYIRSATQATIDSLLGAIVIAVLVIFGFLRSWRATLITVLAIPLSLLGTCIVMAIYGFNLETITLLALALVIGIIVDDAIVEIENIARHIEQGKSPHQAALIATQEIGLTVSASTLTIVAVFLPVAFMGGTVGQFFKPFGLTVSAAVLISLLVARTLSPVLATYWLKSEQHQLHRPGLDPLLDREQAQDTSASEMTAVQKPASALERGYHRLLAWALHHRGMVVGLAIASFIAGIAVIPLIPQGFIPQLDRGEFYLNYTVALPSVTVSSALEGQALEGQTLDRQALERQAAANPTASALTVDPRERILQQSLETAKQLEETIFDLPEVDSVLVIAGNQGQPNQGSFYIKLQDQRSRTTADVQAQLRESLPKLANVTTSVEDIQFVDTGGEKPVQIALLGDDLAILNQSATQVKEAVEALPGFADIRISGSDNTAKRIQEITHQNSQRVALISANLSDGKALGEATQQVVDIANSIIPAGVQIDLGSDSARIGQVLGSFGRTLILGIIAMLVVLFIPFKRLLEPAVVGLALPLSIIGSVLALLITQSDFGLVSLLGLLFLLGLLDKNALLLMDYANQLRRAGMNRTEALLKTGLVRLRPILMTTTSTVLGMLPIALGLGAGAELRQPMAVAIMGGLITSTLLSLVVVPVLYSLLEDGWQRLMKGASS
ncbi:MAG: efflux RND transporter permease subunit [Cyanobacteria bacterium P01_F01_bin.53]